MAGNEAVAGVTMQELKELILFHFLELDQRIELELSELHKKIGRTTAELNNKIDLRASELDNKIDLGLAHVATEVARLERKVSALDTLRLIQLTVVLTMRKLFLEAYSSPSLVAWSLG